MPRGRKKAINGYNDCLRIGSKVSKKIPANHTVEEIAAKLGMTFQGAQQLCMVALGKLVLGIRQARREGLI